MMNKRIIINLALVVLLAGLVWLVNYQEETEQQQRFDKRLSQQTSDNIKRLEYSFTDELGQTEERVFELRDSEWFMTKPAFAHANVLRLEHIFTLLNDTVRASYPVEGKALEQFGLKPSKVRLVFNDETLELGNVNPATRQRYVLKDDEIKMVSEMVYGTLRTSFAGMLSHRMIPPGSKIKELLLPDDMKILEDRFEGINAIEIGDYEENDKGGEKLKAILETGESLFFEVLPSNNDKLIVLGRPDLQVKYTLDRVQLLKSGL